MNLRIAPAVCLALLTAVLCPATAFAQTSCESLANLKLTNATISSATSVAAGSYKPPSAPGAPAPDKRFACVLPRGWHRQAYQRF